MLRVQATWGPTYRYAQSRDFGLRLEARASGAIITRDRRTDTGGGVLYGIAYVHIDDSCGSDFVWILDFRAPERSGTIEGFWRSLIRIQFFYAGP